MIVLQVDGDTDVPSVQQDFTAALYQLMRWTRRKEEETNLRDADFSTIGRHPNGIHAVTDQTERATNNIKQMVNGVSNNHIGNGIDAMKQINGITAQGIITILIIIIL